MPSIYAERNAWPSDEPVWKALNVELQRRFTSDAERIEAHQAIRTEYLRLIEAD